jgi:hypothetical protein
MRRQTGGSIPSSSMWNRCVVFGMGGLTIAAMGAVRLGRSESTRIIKQTLLQRVNLVLMRPLQRRLFPPAFHKDRL